MIEKKALTLSKKLSEESNKLLRELEHISNTASEIIPKLYSSLKKDGLTPMEARDLIEQTVSISQRHLRRLLPDKAKHEEKIRDPVLRTDVRKSESENIKTMPKAIGEISIPTEHLSPKNLNFKQEDSKVILDLKKFGSDLRVMIMNKSKAALWVKNGEVIEIKEV